MDIIRIHESSEFFEIQNPSNSESLEFRIYRFSEFIKIQNPWNSESFEIQNLLKLRFPLNSESIKIQNLWDSESPEIQNLLKLRIPEVQNLLKFRISPYSPPKEPVSLAFPPNLLFSGIIRPAKKPRHFHLKQITKTNAYSFFRVLSARHSAPLCWPTANICLVVVFFALPPSVFSARNERGKNRKQLWAVYLPLLERF